ncbi:hypothetical protein R6Q57_020200 [Mikania cordata]
MASSSASSSSSDSEGIDLFISSLSTIAEENASQIPRPIIRRIQINRDREARHDLLMRHYFGNEPLYNETLFKRRFRMQRHCEGKTITTFVPDEDEPPSSFDIDDPRRDNQILALRNKSVH